MIISSLTQKDVKKHLSGAGLYFKTGPFIIHLKTRIDDISENFYRLYENHQVVNDDSFADYHIRIDLPRNLRRWVKPQVFFYFDEVIPFKPLPYNQAFPMLEWGMNWCIANNAHQYLIIHAAVVEKNGKAIIFPAQPGSGKSTLAAGLVSRGWRLLSDELAIVDVNNIAAVPLARPINLKNESIDIIQKFSPTSIFSGRYDDTNKGTVSLLKPPENSVARTEEEVMPAYIIQPQYRADAEIKLEEESKGRMFMYVAENSFNYSVLGESGYNILTRLIDMCQCYKFSYSRLDEAVDLFDSIINN